MTVFFGKFLFSHFRIYHGSSRHHVCHSVKVGSFPTSCPLIQPQLLLEIALVSLASESPSECKKTCKEITETRPRLQARVNVKNNDLDKNPDLL
jgi:hypothetical protein